MQSLFSKEGLRSISERLDQLQANGTPQWGKMNAGQMLAHVRMAMEVPLGTHKLPPMFIMKFLGGMIRRQILSDKPTSKNSPTAASLKVGDPRDFTREKAALLQTLEKFSAAGRAGQLPDKHPYFGKLSPDEWDRFQQKHLDHHLGQFGV